MAGCWKHGSVQGHNTAQVSGGAAGSRAAGTTGQAALPGPGNATPRGENQKAPGIFTGNLWIYG